MKLRLALLLVGLLLGLSALGLTIPNANAQTETNLHSFASYPTDGEVPFAGLVQGSDGNFYGTANTGGGTNYSGTVFRISPGGIYTNLYSFGNTPNDGANPRAGLVQGSDGNFYGTTVSGGSNDFGTVFRISPSSIYTSLYSFAGPPNDGQNPFAGLVQGSDGNFYGTTEYGGTTNKGTVFRISPSGSETILYSFGTVANDGEEPVAGLAQGNDGNFYGTASVGGTNNNGTVFRISPSGIHTNLYLFGTTLKDGTNPRAGLVQGSDGSFYGTTYLGGTNDVGTVFRISPGGSCTNLYSFAGPPDDGQNPLAGLVQGNDGNFYGTTDEGGGGFGTVFRISPGGSEKAVYSFVGYLTNDGAWPDAGLVQGSDGSFYGTTTLDGENGEGTVFELTVPLNPAPYPINQITAIQFFNVLDSTIVALPIPSVAGETYQLQYSDSMSPTNWINTGDPALSIGGPLVLIDVAQPLPPQRFYRSVITP